MFDVYTKTLQRGKLFLTCMQKINDYNNYYRMGYINLVGASTLLMGYENPKKQLLPFQ